MFELLHNAGRLTRQGSYDRGRMTASGVLVGLLATGVIAGPAAAVTAPGTVAETVSSFAFQPVAIQKIALPSTVTSAEDPEFTKDNDHLLFWQNNQLWITSLSGAGTRCLSCGVPGAPRLPESGDLASPFPDGKRVLMDEDIQPGLTELAVLECFPSLINCQKRTVEQVNFSRAEPAVIAPGGAVLVPQATVAGGAYHAQLSPDGEYIGFSEVRTDSIEVMVVGKLQQAGNEYVVNDAKVINPPAPTSPSDEDAAHWSDSSSLFEFKAFTHGGADATYVQVGGEALMDPQDWQVNLATGQRTRLTGNPDWSEDDGGSPNGKYWSVFSDRTIHFVDWLGGLFPVPDFIDDAASAMVAGTIGGNTECEGPTWLLPAAGDHDGELAGEPLLSYRYPNVHVGDNLDSPNQWSQNGTMVALNTIDKPTGLAAPFILIAHLSAAKPSKPVTPVNSEPGAWAPLPANYHPALGYDGVKTFAGPNGGSVTVDYDGTPGAVAGRWSETYMNYTEGKDVLNGSVTITGSALGGIFSDHLTLSGANTGSDVAQLNFIHGVQGHAVSTYDGHTITGPMPNQLDATTAGGPTTACLSSLPKLPPLRVSATNLGHGRYRVMVTASIAGFGPGESELDVQPVYHAALRLGRVTVYSNNEGVAIVRVRRAHDLTVNAGQTLKPTSANLR
jgi:hypothetical protein